MVYSGNKNKFNSFINWVNNNNINIDKSNIKYNI